MAVRGGTANLSSTIYDGATPADPATLTLTIKRNGATVAGPYAKAVLAHDATGLYSYAWAVPVDAALGQYVAEWSAALVSGDTPTTGYETFAVTSDDAAVVTGDLYCSVAEARTAGAAGTDDLVVEAIRQATTRVELFTGDLFTPRTRTVVARVGGDGRALLPYRLTTTDAVVSVDDHDTAMAYGAGTFRATTSAVDGDVDAIALGREWVGANMLVAGLEPWAPRRTWTGARVRVVATFGWAETPAPVSMATAQLAAQIVRTLRGDDDGNPVTPNPETTTSTDPEGNVIPVVPPFAGDAGEAAAEDVAAGRRTTGLRSADALLIPFRRVRTFVGV